MRLTRAKAKWPFTALVTGLRLNLFFGACSEAISSILGGRLPATTLGQAPLPGQAERINPAGPGKKPSRIRRFEIRNSEEGEG
jgi:hypothetical protein